MEDSDVVGVGAEGELEDVGRRNAILDLHRPLVHHQHRARRDDEQYWHELRIQQKLALAIGPIQIPSLYLQNIDTQFFL